MDKKKKRQILLAAAITLGIIVAIAGILLLVKRGRSNAVKVFDMSNFAVTNYWGVSSETYGNVTLDKMQTVYISDTQKVSEIYVQEGQNVKAGEPLLAYDTTLTDIALEKADIALQKLKLQQQTAKQALQNLNAMRPHSSVLVTPNNPTPDLTPQTTPKRIRGTGTVDDPYYYLWGQDDTYSNTFLQSLFSTAQAPDEGSQDPATPTADGEVYAVFMIRENNSMNGAVENSWGMYLQQSGGEISWQMFQASIPEDLQVTNEPEEPYYVESGSDYTAAELVKLRAEKAKEITNLSLQIKVAEVDLKQKQQEMTNGVVTSKLDGVVKSVKNADEAYSQSAPVIVVSGGGGYYVQGAISELELGTISVGQEVDVRSMENDAYYTGSITAISPYPTTNANTWSMGNANVSYYPITVFIDEDATLRESESVLVTYQAGVSSDGLYLQSQFIRTENGQSYVFVAGENGKLEKRIIQTGKSPDGYMTEIRSGLTIDEKIAFPYGTAVKDGAATQEGTIDEFYQ